MDDGGGGFEGCRLFAEGPIRLLQLRSNQGKSAAVRAGMLAAHGKTRIFTDADLPYDLDPFHTIAGYILNGGFHVVLGDRTLPGSSYEFGIGWKRRLASSAYSKLAGGLVGGFYDTQCGLKGFRDDVAEALFNTSRINRFAFDAEVIHLCVSHRLNIKHIPVKLRRSGSSSIRLLRDSTRMLVDTFVIKRNQLRGAYRSQRLEEIVSRDQNSLMDGMASTSGAVDGGSTPAHCTSQADEEEKSSRCQPPSQTLKVSPYD